MSDVHTIYMEKATCLRRETQQYEQTERHGGFPGFRAQHTVRENTDH